MILVNDRHYLNDFIQLNEAWITHYFKLEAADAALARNPGKIIDDGGYVFSLLSGNEVAGVCALFNDGDGVFQLARMAVHPLHQGKGYGHELMHAALGQLLTVNARKVYLLSNTCLTVAMALYAKHGFAIVRKGQHPVYARSDVVMERCF